LYYIKFLVAIVLIAYIILIVLLYVMQDSMVFVGANSFKKKLQDEQYLSKHLEKQNFVTSDEVLLDGAIYTNNNDKLIIYFGGNASNSISFLNTFTNNTLSYDILSFNYRGFAYSNGKPSEEKLYSDALEIYNKYKSNYKEIIIIGRSLGTAIASYLSSQIKSSNLILITPFDSILNIAQRKYPYIWIKYLLKNKFDSVKNLKNNKTFCSIVMVKNDEVVSNQSTQILKDNILNLKNYIIIDDGSTHGDITQNKKVIEFIKESIK